MCAGLQKRSKDRKKKIEEKKDIVVRIEWRIIGEVEILNEEIGFAEAGHGYKQKTHFYIWINLA